MVEEVAKKSRKIRKFVFHNKDIEEVLEIPREELISKFNSRIQRKFRRSEGVTHQLQKLIERVKKSMKNLQPGEKPAIIKTHLRNGIVFPEMVGGRIGVYNGKEYKEVEVKLDMIGSYLGEYSITYKPTLRKAAFLLTGKKGKKGGR